MSFSGVEHLQPAVFDDVRESRVAVDEREQQLLAVAEHRVRQRGQRQYEHGDVTAIEQVLRRVERAAVVPHGDPVEELVYGRSALVAHDRDEGVRWESRCARRCRRVVEEGVVRRVHGSSSERRSGEQDVGRGSRRLPPPREIKALWRPGPFPRERTREQSDAPLYTQLVEKSLGSGSAFFCHPDEGRARAR